MDLSRKVENTLAAISRPFFRSVSCLLLFLHWFSLPICVSWLSISSVIHSCRPLPFRTLSVLIPLRLSSFLSASEMSHLQANVRNRIGHSVRLAAHKVCLIFLLKTILSFFSFRLLLSLSSLCKETLRARSRGSPWTKSSS